MLFKRSVKNASRHLKGLVIKKALFAPSYFLARFFENEFIQKSPSTEATKRMTQSTRSKLSPVEATAPSDADAEAVKNAAVIEASAQPKILLINAIKNNPPFFAGSTAKKQCTNTSHYKNTKAIITHFSKNAILYKNLFDGRH